MCCSSGTADLVLWVHLPEVLVRAVAGLFLGDVESDPGRGSAKQLAARFALLAIRQYQLRISARTPARCRFVPSCSAYAADAIDRFGFLGGLRKTCSRLVRCRVSVPASTPDPVSSAPAR